PDFTPQKTAYQNYVSTILRLLSWPEPDQSAKAMIEFETKIAEASWTKAQQRDLSAIYNPMSLQELTKFAPGFAWQKFLMGANMPNVSRVIVAEKSAFPKIAEIYANTPIEIIRASQAFHLADNAAP